MSSATSAPALVTWPLMRTVGYGLIIFALAFFLAATFCVFCVVAGLGCATGAAIGSPDG